jgi:hypothetical protein
MIDAAADTLHKAWRAGIDLAARGRPSAPRRHRAPGSGGPRPASVRHDASSRHRRRRDRPHQSCAGGPRPDGDRRPYRTFAVLAAAAPGPHRPYPRAVDGRPEERSRMAGRHGRHDRARTGASAGGQRRQRGDGLSRGHRGDALGAQPARLGRLALGDRHRDRLARRL